MFGKSYRKTPMKTLIQIKTTILSVRKSMRPTVAGFLIPLLLVCFGFMQKAQATDLGSVLPNGNTADGSGVLVSLTSGVWNSGFGFEALNHDTAGKDNTATGYRALNRNTIGTNNTANGVDALVSNTTGSINTAIGVSALLNNSTGNLNTALGGGAGNNVLTASNVICIGASGADGSNSCFIANIYGVNEGGTISTVYINSNGQLGTQAPPSSRRFKKEIKPMDHAR